MKSSNTVETRHVRQTALPEIGQSGQERLSKGSVLMVGVGGLGSVAGLYLAAAGVGRLGIVDDDQVELSNLQRQICHSTPDCGRLKTDSAKQRLLELNPDVVIEAFPVRFTQTNAESLLGEWDFVLDATDNFEAKFLIADACHRLGKSYSHAGIAQFLGQTMTVVPGKTACYRCLFDTQPDFAPDDPPKGPMGPVPGVIGSLQAMEAIKFLVGCGDLLTDRILTYNALTAQFREIRVKRNPECRLCHS